MDDKRRAAADIVLRIIPLVMRALAMQLRQNQDGLRASHYGVLTMLSAGTHSLTQLAQELSVSLPTMSNTCKTLEGYGWVERLRNPENRRQISITLSEHGRELLADIQHQASDLVVAALSDLSDKECLELERSLETLGRCLCEKAIDASHQQEPLTDAGV